MSIELRAGQRVAAEVVWAVTTGLVNRSFETSLRLPGPGHDSAIAGPHRDTRTGRLTARRPAHGLTGLRHQELSGEGVGLGFDVIDRQRIGVQYKMAELVDERQPDAAGRRGIVEQNDGVVLRAAAYLCAAVLPDMQARGFGRIINIEGQGHEV